MHTIAKSGTRTYLIADHPDREVSCRENVPGFIVDTRDRGPVHPVNTQTAIKHGYWDEAEADPARDAHLFALIHAYKAMQTPSTGEPPRDETEEAGRTG